MASPLDVNAIVEGYGKWLSESEIPKLFIAGDPGAIIKDGVKDFCRGLRNQREITVKGTHLVQEDSPHEIGTALQEFVRTVAAEDAGART